MINTLDKKRSAYRKRAAVAQGCQFCSAKNIKEQAIKKLEGEHWRVWVNKYPYMDGNLMVIPKRHIKEPTELNAEEWQELQAMIGKALQGLSRITPFADYNIGLNVGKLAGASIEHLHWQIIPRTVKIQNAANIFGQIQVITIEPKELKETLESAKK